MNILKKFLDLLSDAERKRAILLIVMMIIMATLDMVGVASILPFISVISNPSLLETNEILRSAYEFSGVMGVETENHFLFLLGMLVFLLLVTSLAFKALTTYAQTRFAMMREYSISKRLVEGYLNQPYSWFLHRHSADLGKNILSEVNIVIYNGLLPLMTLISQSAVTIALLLLLLFIDPLLALIVGLVLGLAYGLIIYVMSAWLKNLGAARVVANRERYEVVSEAFGAVKEIKASALEETFSDRFAKPAEIYAKGQATAIAISQIPRFFIEAVAFGGMLLIILYLMAQGGDFASALPVIALYTFAGYRLMPALQQIYGAISQLKYAKPALDSLHRDFQQLSVTESSSAPCDRLMLKNGIELKGVSYVYPNSQKPTLNALNLQIPARSRVGLVGLTGSGKTTIIDLILGLLEASKGALLVDGETIMAGNRRSWQRTIGYVPQQIYLSDSTIAANIAFGVDKDDIDESSIIRAAKIANLHEFVCENLNQKYETLVGERGVRLSGGQRQRIGIARALYHRPQLLVLDEATSALDNVTEQIVMEALNNLDEDVTVILVAHRLSTVKTCDKIFLLKEGQLKAEGTFDELLQNSEEFSKMARLGEA